MLLKVYCSLFSAVAACTFNCPIVDLLMVETRINRLIGEHLLSSVMNKKERETWKMQCGSTQWKV